MPLLVAPGTTSPGAMNIRYTGMGGVDHVARLRFVSGEYVTDQADASALAATVAAAIAGMMTADAFTAYAWYVTNEDNVMVLRGGFDPEVSGTIITPQGPEGSRSASLTFTGRGIPAGLTGLAGQTKITLFTGDTWAIPAGVNRITAVGGTDLEDFIDFLNGQERLWADIYGQKAQANTYVSPQYNAHIQRVHGT